MNIVKKHPYIFVPFAAVLLSIVVWMLVPKYYRAQTIVSDEYKETDLGVGLTQFSAHIRNLIGGVRTGVNDVEVYARILKTYDFAKKIANVRVPGRNVRYADYLGEKDTLDAIRDNIEYNISRKKALLTVAFSDRDPLVASQMLDSVMVYLQADITKARRDMSVALMNNSLKDRYNAAVAYKRAQREYSSFVDSHFDMQTEEDKSKEESLRKNVDKFFDAYNTAAEACVRNEMLSKRSYFSFAVLDKNTVPTETSSYLIGYVLFALFFSLIFLKGYFLYQDLRSKPLFIDMGGATSPWCITLVVWGVLMFAMMFRDPSLLMAPTSQFYVSLGLWLVFFTISSFMTYNLLPTNSVNIRQIEKQSASPVNLTRINKIVFNFLFGISIIITPLYLKKIMDIVMMFGTDDLMSNMRTLAVYGNEQSFLNYAIVINEVLMIVSLWAYPHVKKWQMVLACTMSVLNSLAIMEKGGLLLVIFCVIFILYQRKYIKIRTIAVIGVLVMFLSYGFNMLRFSEETLKSNKDITIFSFIAMYLLSPPVAYCQLSQELVPQFGGHTFPLFYLFLNKTSGGNYVFFDRLQEFVFVPVSTNVYTIFQPFFMDFGQTGIAVFAVVYGVLTGWAYRLMRNGNAFGKCLYMYIGYVLALQFFQEYIFTGNLHIIQLIFFIFMCTQNRINISIGKHV